MSPPQRPPQMVSPIQPGILTPKEPAARCPEVQFWGFRGFLPSGIQYFLNSHVLQAGYLGEIALV